MKIVTWIVRIIVAGILLQTLYFKFTAHPDSVYIFETVGFGAPGRIGIGIVELIASLLILWPKTTFFGTLMALGIISGAIISHFTHLGIEVRGGGGTLFMLACMVLVGSLFLASVFALSEYRSRID